MAKAKKKKQVINNQQITQAGIDRLTQQTYFIDYGVEQRTIDENGDWKPWRYDRWVRDGWNGPEYVENAVGQMLRWNSPRFFGQRDNPRQGRITDCIKIWRQDELSRPVEESDVEKVRRRLKRLEEALEHNNKPADEWGEQGQWNIADIEYGGQYGGMCRDLQNGERVNFAFHNVQGYEREVLYEKEAKEHDEMVREMYQHYKDNPNQK